MTFVKSSLDRNLYLAARPALSIGVEIVFSPEDELLLYPLRLEIPPGEFHRLFPVVSLAAVYVHAYVPLLGQRVDHYRGIGQGHPPAEPRLVREGLPVGPEYGRRRLLLHADEIDELVK